MKVRYYLAVIILVLVLVSVYVYLVNQSKPEAAVDDNFYSISEFKQNNFTIGEFKTEGYVVKIYSCPLCPTGFQCKLCLRNNIIISENNQLLENYYLTNKELIIFSDNVQIFELGQKYQFSVRILDYRSTSEPINDIEIISFNLIK